MKELLAGEIFDKSYVAIPINEGQLLNWVQGINNNKIFYHMTIYFLGQIDNSDLDKVKNSLSSLTKISDGFSLAPQKLDFIGKRRDVFVLKIKETDNLLELRNVLEKTLPEKMHLNLPFLPHVTVEKAKWGVFNRHEEKRLLDIPDISKHIEPYLTDIVGVYYRTEENATALLYSINT